MVQASLVTPGIAYAAEPDDKAIEGQGPWISAVTWQDSQTVVGTESQGLLLRPGTLVSAEASDPGELTKIADFKTSLWAIVQTSDQRLVVADYKGGVHVVSNGKTQQFDCDLRWVRSLVCGPDGKQVLAGTEDGQLAVLSLSEMNESQRIEVGKAAIFDIAISHDQEKIAIASGDGQISLLSWPELKPLGSMSRGDQAVWSVVFSEDDRYLISGGADRRIQLWSVPQRGSLLTLQIAPDWITSLTLLPKSTLVAAGCMNGQVLLVDHQSMQPVLTSEPLGSAVWSVALSPDQQHLAVGTRKHGLQLVDVSDWSSTAAAVAEEAAKQRPPQPTVTKASEAPGK